MADPLEAAQHWLAQGADAADPVRRTAIQALARRAAAQQGPARAVMLRRLAQWLEDARPGAHGVQTDLPASASTVSAQDGRAGTDAPSPVHPSSPARTLPFAVGDGDRAEGSALTDLSALVDRLGRMPAGPVSPLTAKPATAARAAAVRTPSKTSPARAPAPTAAQVAAPQPLKAVAAYQGTWSRLRAEQRLRQALAQVPAQAGPLNSSHVVHRVLKALHELSPAYLDAFMAHIDTLLALEQASGAGDLTPRPAATPEAPRRPPSRPRKG